MTLATYPATIPQCFPTTRTEVTTVLAETSENGVIRGRCPYDSPTYELALSHNALTLAQWQSFDQWWEAHRNDEIEVTWVADGRAYRGIFQSPPNVEFAPDLPENSWNVQVVLLVKARAAIEPTGVTVGAPGAFLPAAAALPEDLTVLQSFGSLGSSTAWPTGSYVVLGDASEAHWDGTQWQAGRAP